eukprot:m.116015 g.116015  ORF g.116015 m.116015 type:complete len:563 (-) comp19420_c0_seq5:37-1725(-)
MEFDDILKYKPKAAQEDDEAGAAAEDDSAAKRKRADEEYVEDEDRPIDEEERDRILAMLAKEEATAEPGFDVAALRRLVLSLEKKVSRNQELRIKFPKEPIKFVDSEIEMHQAVQELHVVATAPQLYSELVRLQTVKTLLSLLIHENTDVAMAVIGLLNEMTDVDIVEEEDEAEEAQRGLALLLQEFKDVDLFSVLLQTVQRLDEKQKEDAEAVHKALGVLENCSESEPTFLAFLMAHAPWVAWLVQRVQPRTHDDNRLYASELLAMLLSHSSENRQVFAARESLDTLLQCLARYKKRDPEGSDEAEYMENLFGCLCSLLMERECQDKFIKAEGVELMLLMLREQKHARFGALRVLSFATGGEGGVPACKLFVERLGLRSVFALFMKTPRSALKKSGYNEREFEEQLLTILTNLLRNLQDEALRKRVLAKFSEADCAKLDHLAELHLQYYKRAEARSQQVDEEIAAEGLELEPELMENERYLRRMEGGLHALQMIDTLAAEAIFGLGDAAKERFEKVLALKGSSLETVVRTLQEHARNIDSPTHYDMRLKDRLLLHVQLLSM